MGTTLIVIPFTVVTSKSVQRDTSQKLTHAINKKTWTVCALASGLNAMPLLSAAALTTPEIIKVRRLNPAMGDVGRGFGLTKSLI